MRVDKDVEHGGSRGVESEETRDNSRADGVIRTRSSKQSVTWQTGDRPARYPATDTKSHGVTMRSCYRRTLLWPCRTMGRHGGDGEGMEDF